MFQALLKEVNERRLEVENDVKTSDYLSACTADSLPDFVDSTVTKLTSDWNSLVSLAAQRRDSLKVSKSFLQIRFLRGPTEV